jgi:hypothetical protein
MFSFLRFFAPSDLCSYSFGYQIEPRLASNSEHEMITTSVMKKQYQDMFALNEKEKQKCKRSRKLIPT